MHKFVVVDEILNQLDAAQSGVVPGSVTQSVVSGVQNVPANIIQTGLEAGGGCYTTFPLSPIVKNCNLDKTYINLEFDMNLSLSYPVIAANKGAAGCVIPLWIGFRDTSSIFNQIQILIENSAIKTSTYHREESVICYNALPETEIRGNNQYSSIEKLRLNKYSPMKRILVQIPNTAGVTKTDIKLHFHVTVDINRLDPLLSNIHFTTPHFGNLRLKVWIQRIQEAMFFCPDYSYYTKRAGKSAGTSQANYEAAMGTVTTQPIQNAYWCFYPLATYMQRAITKDMIPFYAISKDSNNTDHVVNDIVLLDSVTFGLHSNQPFLTFNGGVAEIVQKNFDIKEEEYKRLSDYFASTGSIIIPTQTLESQTFNNSSIKGGDNWIPTQIGTIGGYNVNILTTWSHPQTQATCFMKEFLKDIQLILDGRPVNALPYSFVSDKCIVDCTQALIDTDEEEINSDYISSLSCFNITDTAAYTEKAYSAIYGDGSLNSSICCNSLCNPNTFALNFSTNLPDAFHSGACILENSNRNGVVRFNSTILDSDDNLKSDNFPLILTHKTLPATDAAIIGFSAFCDCCIVLTYDAVRGTCFDGQLSWAAPYL